MRLPHYTVSINNPGVTHRRDSDGSITAVGPVLTITVTKAGVPLDLELFRGFDLLQIVDEVHTEITPIGYLSNSEFRTLMVMVEDGTLPTSWEEIDVLVEDMRSITG